MNGRTLVFSLLLACAAPLFASDESDTTRILLPNMLQGAVTELEPLLRSRAGAPLQIEYVQMAKLVERLGKGERADVTVVNRAATQQLAAQGRVKSQAELVQSELGLAVADSAPTPVLKTTEDFIAFLKATPSIAYFGTGASGAVFTAFLEKHGLTEVIKAKATVATDGFVASLVRDGKVASAIQPVSELKFGGANNVVPLPDSAQARSISSVVVFNNARAEVTDRIVQVLMSDEAAAAYRRAGLMPMFK